MPSDRVARARLNTVLVAILVVSVLALGGGFTYLLINKSKGDRADRAQFDQLAQIVADNQRARLSNIRNNCETTNRSHDDTIHALDRVLLERLTGRRVPAATSSDVVARRLAAAIAGGGREGKAVESGRTSTVLLINALAPKRDCDEVVADAKSP